MLDHLKIDSYGEKLQLKSIGNVSVRNAQLLVVSAFDPEVVSLYFVNFRCSLSEQEH